MPDEPFIPPLHLPLAPRDNEVVYYLISIVRRVYGDLSMISNNTSDVAKILWQIEQEYQASKQGLEGLASGTARHDFINAKTENIGKHHEQLAELVGPEQAIAMIANTIWSPADQESAR